MNVLPGLANACVEKIEEICWNPQKHYTRHIIKKSNKKDVRWLHEPHEELKEMQYSLLYNIIYKFKPHDKAYGFKRKTSLIDGAKFHIGKKVLLNLDVKNFFPSIGKARVINWSYYALNNLAARGLISSDILASDAIHLADLLCFRNGLPQGAPTSPALSNLIFKPLDTQLWDWCASEGVAYTRYADDLSFSHDDSSFDVNKIIAKVREVLQPAGLYLNHSKTRVMRPHKRMEVTGVVVNEKASIARWKWRNLKAEIHNLVKRGEPITPLRFKKIKGKLSWLKQVKGWESFPHWAHIDELKLLVN